MNEKKQLPKRLRRLTNVRQPNPRYFLTLCTENREPILASDPVHSVFIEFMRGSPERYGWSCGEYVLMPDHAHFFAAPSPDAVTLGAWVKAIRAFIRQAGTAGLRHSLKNPPRGVTRPTVCRDICRPGDLTGRWLANNDVALAGIERGIRWQKGFFDHVLRTAESYSAKWAYVRQNPVRAGLVAEADDWPFLGQIDVLTM